VVFTKVVFSGNFVVNGRMLPDVNPEKTLNLDKEMSSSIRSLKSLHDVAAGDDGVDKRGNINS
jgi:endo-1,4-beta-mannosidase